MTYLIASICASTLIFIIFRLFTRFEIDTFQAIVYNYFTAFFFGFLLYGSEFKPEAMDNLSWVPLVLICGLLFIILFLLLGFSSQKNGLALTSVAIKMSMAVSLTLLIFWNNETITTLKISGILLAILGVLLMSLSSAKDKPENKPILWMLLGLFLGGGLLDFSLNYAQNNVLEDLHGSLFCAIGFAVAGLFGLIILCVDFARKKRQFAIKHLLAGVVLGIPNFFSIFLLLKSYEVMEWTDSTVLAVTNISIVVLSSLVGFSFFKEQLNVRKTIGLVVSISAILTLYYAGK